MAAVNHNMGSKLWTVLLIVAAMTAVTTQIDLSNIGGGFSGLMGLGGKTEVTTTPIPVLTEETYDNYDPTYDNYGQTSVNSKPALGFKPQLPNKGVLSNHFAGVDPTKLNKFDSTGLHGGLNKFDTANHAGGLNKFDSTSLHGGLNKFDSVKPQVGLNKFEHNPLNVHDKFNTDKLSGDKLNKDKILHLKDKNQTLYSPISVASPVEYPTYSTYDQSLSPPIIDDGTYTSPPYGYNRPAFRGPNRGRPNRPYGPQPGPQSYGQIGPPPRRPPASQYGNRPMYGQQPGYGNRGPDRGPLGPPVIVPQDAGYHEVPLQYSGPSLDTYHGNNYGQSYGPTVDYSKYVSPMPYTEVSEYMSPAQYSEYTGMLYSAYNLSPPGPQSYQNNYSSQRTNYNNNNNYNKDNFKMIVAVVVLSGSNDYQYKSKDFTKDKTFGMKDINSIQGTLFISEIYPYVSLVSGVITGMPPNHKFGVAIHTYGDLTNGCHSIGGHYNPTNRTHGNINAPQSHVGDLGNLQSDLAGVAFVNKISRNQFSIQSRNPVAGRSIGICNKEDDLGLGGTIASLRDGSCGNVMACGIIGLANTYMPASNSGHH